MGSEARKLRAVISFALVTAGVFSLLLALDVWLGLERMRRGDPDEEIVAVHEPHPRLGWVPRPGSGRHVVRGSFDVSYGIDPDGLRRVPDSGRSGPTIWILGDSFTFGHGVSDQETWPSRLARDWLVEDRRVRNAGVMGYGLAQEVQRLRELAPRIQPGDRVVLAPLSVDFERSLDHFGHPSRYLFRPEKGPVVAYPAWRHGRLEIARFDTPRNRLRALFYNARLTGPGLRRLHHWLEPPQPVDDGAALIDLARTLSESRGARFGWLLLPHPRECLGDGYRVDVSALAPPDLERFFPNDPEGVSAIQLREDPHWNARGHALAARAVAETLLELGVLDRADLKADPRAAGRRPESPETAAPAAAAGSPPAPG